MKKVKLYLSTLSHKPCFIYTTDMLANSLFCFLSEPNMSNASLYATTIIGSYQETEHKLIRAYDLNHRKKCALCSYLNIRTKSGWRPNTYHKCLECDVPLCVGERDCFNMYHKLLHEGISPLTPRRRVRMSQYHCNTLPYS